METERIALSQRERERLKVLHEAKEKHLTQAEAGERLKVSRGCFSHWIAFGVAHQPDAVTLNAALG